MGVCSHVMCGHSHVMCGCSHVMYVCSHVMLFCAAIGPMVTGAQGAIAKPGDAVAQEHFEAKSDQVKHYVCACACMCMYVYVCMYICVQVRILSLSKRLPLYSSSVPPSIFIHQYFILSDF